MKLSDALTQFETRLSKTEGGVITMTPDDLVKYLGEQLTLAETEGDAGKPRREAAKAVIEAAKAAEATGATTFDVKAYVAPAAPEKAEKADPILEALNSLSTTVKGLKEGLDKAAAPTPPIVPPTGGETQADVTKGKPAETPTGDDVAKNAKVLWPFDLNAK